MLKLAVREAEAHLLGRLLKQGLDLIYLSYMWRLASIDSEVSIIDNNLLFPVFNLF